FLLLNESESDPVEIDRTGLEVFENDFYIFGYEEDWIIQEGSPLFVFEKEPSTLAAGDFNTNVNILYQDDSVDKLNSSICKETAKLVIEQFGTVFDAVELESAEMKKIPAGNSCEIHYSGEYLDTSFAAKQYLILDT